MDIKDELVLNGMTWEAADEIEYNTIGEFQTRDSNTPGYYIFLWTGNAYTLQEKYTCHAFNPPVIITEGELVCPWYCIQSCLILPDSCLARKLIFNII